MKLSFVHAAAVASVLVGGCGLSVVGATPAELGSVAPPAIDGGNGGSDADGADGDQGIDGGVPALPGPGPIAPDGGAGVVDAAPVAPDVLRFVPAGGATIAEVSSTVDVSKEGVLDWRVWFSGAPAAQKDISTARFLDTPATAGTNNQFPVAITWSDGKPPSKTGSTTVFGYSTGTLTFRVSADATPRRLQLWFTHYAAQCELKATLVPSTLPPITITRDNAGGGAPDWHALRTEIELASASSGAQVQIDWRVVQSHTAQSSVALIAAALR